MLPGTNGRVQECSGGCFSLAGQWSISIAGVALGRCSGRCKVSLCSYDTAAESIRVFLSSCLLVAAPGQVVEGSTRIPTAVRNMAVSITNGHSTIADNDRYSEA